MTAMKTLLLAHSAVPSLAMMMTHLAMRNLQKANLQKAEASRAASQTGRKQHHGMGHSSTHGSKPRAGRPFLSDSPSKPQRADPTIFYVSSPQLRFRATKSGFYTVETMHNGKWIPSPSQKVQETFSPQQTAPELLRFESVAIAFDRKLWSSDPTRGWTVDSHSCTAAITCNSDPLWTCEITFGPTHSAHHGPGAQVPTFRFVQNSVDYLDKALLGGRSSDNRDMMVDQYLAAVQEILSKNSDPRPLVVMLENAYEGRYGNHTDNAKKNLPRARGEQNGRAATEAQARGTQRKTARRAAVVGVVTPAGGSPSHATHSHGSDTDDTGSESGDEFATACKIWNDCVSVVGTVASGIGGVASSLQPVVDIIGAVV